MGGFGKAKGVQNNMDKTLVADIFSAVNEAYNNADFLPSKKLTAWMRQQDTFYPELKDEMHVRDILRLGHDDCSYDGCWICLDRDRDLLDDLGLSEDGREFIEQLT